jgi:RNA polymerase sigma-70 factor (ECF subfamily)
MDSTERRQFTELVQPHFDALYRSAYRLTRHRADAEDLVQEVCLRAIANIADLGATDSPRAWLLRVQYRLFVDARRRWRRSPVRLADGAAESADTACADDPGPEADAAAWAVRRELADAWRCLDLRQQALLGLHAEGYNLTELASITGLSKSVLSARLHRARSRLARLLQRPAPAGLPITEQES